MLIARFDESRLDEIRVNAYKGLVNSLTSLPTNPVARRVVRE
jgi:hypothetical protein